MHENNASGSGRADTFLSSDIFTAHSEKYSLEKLHVKQSLVSLQEFGKRVPSLSTIYSYHFTLTSKIVEKMMELSDPIKFSKS